MAVRETVSEQVSMREDMILHRGGIVIDELRATVRTTGAQGFDYISVKMLEDTMIALAAINGAKHVSSIEAAIDYLQELEAQPPEERYAEIGKLEEQLSDSIERNKVLQNVLEERYAEIGKLEEQLNDSIERNKVLQNVLAEHKNGAAGTLIKYELFEDTLNNLKEVSRVLERVPGQRVLAKETLRVLGLLKEEEIGLYIPVDEDAFAEAFCEEKGSAQSI